MRGLLLCYSHCSTFRRLPVTVYRVLHMRHRWLESTQPRLNRGFVCSCTCVSGSASASLFWSSSAHSDKPSTKMSCVMTARRVTVNINTQRRRRELTAPPSQPTPGDGYGTMATLLEPTACCADPIQGLESSGSSIEAVGRSLQFIRHGTYSH